MRHLDIQLLVGLAILQVSVPSPRHSQAQEGHPALRSFLVEKEILDENELKALAKGRAIAKIVQAKEDRETAVVGIIRIDVPLEFFLQRYSDLSGLHSRDGILQIEKVRAPPSLDDFAALRFPEKDLKDLKNGTVGDCEVKLPQEVLQRLRADVDWSGDAHAEVNAIIREMLFRRTNNYLSSGLSGLAPYVDKKDPQSVADGMGKIMGYTPMLYDYVPEFHDYMKDFPNGNLELTTDFVYWSVGKFGMKPTVELKHVVTYEPPEDHPSKVVIAEIGLYASHYYVATVSITSWVETDLDGNGPASYLVECGRSWFDGDVKGFKRRKLNGRVKKSLRETLERRRDQMEAAYEK